MKNRSLTCILLLAFSLTNSHCSKKNSGFNSQRTAGSAAPLNREELEEVAKFAENASPESIEAFDEFYRSLTFDLYHQILYSIVPRESVVIAGVEISDFQEVVAANEDVFDVLNDEFENLGDFFDQVEQNPQRWVTNEDGDVDVTPSVEPFNIEDLLMGADADLLEESYLALYETLQESTALRLGSPRGIAKALFLQGTKRKAADAGIGQFGPCPPGGIKYGQFDVTSKAYNHVCEHVNGTGAGKPKHTLFASAAVAQSSFQALSSICKENSKPDGRGGFNAYLRIPGAGQQGSQRMNYVKVAYGEKPDGRFNLITMYPTVYAPNPAANTLFLQEQCQSVF